jgi:hypothetical protein
VQYVRPLGYLAALVLTVHDWGFLNIPNPFRSFLGRRCAPSSRVGDRQKARVLAANAASRRVATGPYGPGTYHSPGQPHREWRFGYLHAIQA